jgi:uncharacterized protein (DUF2252 family)
MMSTRLLGKAVFIREVLPQDMKLEIAHLSREEAMSVAEFLAHVVGHGHARQLDGAGRKQWLTELQRNRSKSLDAPSWLWTNVVDLVATHEASYLEHCRRYSLEERLSAGSGGSPTSLSSYPPCSESASAIAPRRTASRPISP